MSRFLLWVLLLLSSVVVLSSAASEDDQKGMLKSSVYHSPPFFLRPGSVVDTFFYNIPLPSGHNAIKRFDTEVVDEIGVSVPLYETYLHHWTLFRYYARKGSVDPKEVSALDPDFSKIIFGKNAGICNLVHDEVIGQGSETRKLSTWIPGPYGIEVGNPDEAPVGYEERWMLNVHAIDTRDVEDRLGCTECRCGLYNVSKHPNGNPLPKNYIGGLLCCRDQSQCRTRSEGGSLEGAQLRKLYLKYTVSWVEWSESVVPVKIYMFDVTDAGILSNDTFTGNYASNCKVEYDVKACGIEGQDNGKCVDTKKTTVVIPHGGEIIYGVGHQHAGGVGISLYGEDGRVLCTSMPYYGKGKEAGNELGYIVGMSTCYPVPGSVKVADGEHLTLVSNYSNSMQHTGVMGFFNILVADPQPKPVLTVHHTLPISYYAWAFIVTGGFIAVVISVLHRRRYNREGGYEELATA